MSKRRMPVNVLEGGQSETEGGELLDRIVRSEEVPESGAEAGSPRSPRSSVAVPSSPEVRDRMEARRLERANGDVRLWALGSALIGLVQVGWIAFLLVVALQMKMAGSLAERYQIFFPRDLVKRLGVCLFGGVISLAGSSILEYVLFSGDIFDIVWLGVSIALSTLVVGKTFIKHYEAGETLFGLDPRPMKEFFRRKYGEGA